MPKVSVQKIEVLSRHHDNLISSPLGTAHDVKQEKEDVQDVLGDRMS